MKLTTLTAATAALFVFVQSAEAREHHHHYRHHGVVAQQTEMPFASPFGFGAAGVQQSAARIGGRPSAWCGWEMRQLVGADPGPSYNLARNWTRWGRSGPAGVGAVVVWAHHVGKIVGGSEGHWIIESGNDGHAVRTRERSIAGVIAVRWG
jgi:hypothetical protein